MKNLSIINKTIFLINSISLFLLLICYISPYTNPNIFSPISFIGLLFPVLYILNSIFLIYWIIFFKKQIWPNIIILLIGAQYINSYINITLKEEDNNNSIKIISYNVRIFNEYNWIPEINKEDIFSFIKELKGDVLCIQEFYKKRGIPNLNYKFMHIEEYDNEDQGHLAIYSNYPQINKSTISINNKDMNNTCIYSDIIINNDTIRFYNIHLASNWFKSTDYAFLTDTTYKKEEIKTGLQNIIKRMQNAYKKRADQVLIIKKHIQSSPYKVIICGDMNDTPISFTYRNIKGDLLDSFSISGNGFGQSFVKIPTLRIDYIMHDKNIKSFNHKKEKKIFSDHYPISCKIKI